MKFFIGNSKEKIKTSKIPLTKDLIDMKAHNKHGVSVFKPYLFVLACLLIELHLNFLLIGLPNWGDNLPLEAAYTWTFTVH